MLARSPISLRFRSAVIFPLLASLIVGYFAFYTFFGERSLIRLMQLEAKTQSVQTKLANSKAEHEAYRARVERMRSGSIDVDLLDEQSRKVLNYSQPDEIVIYTSEKN